jgi:intracellular septation protein
MQALLEFAPLAAFLAAYYVAGFYVATAVLMVGMALLLGVDLLRTRRIPMMHGASAALVFAFGTATLVLHDRRFIEWKPTVFFWALAAAFLASGWIGAKPLAQRLLEAALGATGRIGRPLWLRLNLAWVAFYLALGGVNLYVAWNASERTWVEFKVFGLTLATLVFVIVQALWLARQPAARLAASETSAEP